MWEVPVRIKGIPAIAKVTYYFHQKPLGKWADSDLDCYGYTDCEYEVCDKRGRLAPWLERKMTADDFDKVTQQIEDWREEREYD